MMSEIKEMVEMKEVKVRKGKGRPKIDNPHRLPTAVEFLASEYRKNPQDVSFGKNAIALLNMLYRAPLLEIQDGKNIVDQYVKFINWNGEQRMIEPVITKGKQGLSSVAAVMSRLKKECLKVNVKDQEYMVEMERLKFALPHWKAEFDEFDSLPLAVAEHTRLKYRYHPTGSPAKKIISRLQPVPKGLRELRLSREDAENMKETRKKQLEIKLKKVPLPINADAILTAAREWIKSTSIDDLVPALLLLTGRRTTEIILTGKFDETPLKDPMRAVFSGQLKSGLLGNQPYEIPLLAPLGEIQAALAVVRAGLSSPDGSDPALAHRKYSMVVRRMVNKKIKPIIGLSIAPHVLRSTYAAICNALYNTPQKMAYTAFLSTLLGHESLISALHYQSVQVNNLPQAAPPIAV